MKKTIIAVIAIVLFVTATSGCTETDHIDWMYDGYASDELNSNNSDSSDTNSESGNDKSSVEENENNVEQMTGSSSSSGEWVEVTENEPKPLFNSEPED